MRCEVWAAPDFSPGGGKGGGKGQGMWEQMLYMEGLLNAWTITGGTTQVYICTWRQYL